MRILHIIHPELDFSTVDPSSKLLTSSDITNINGNCHTSLGDLKSNEICSIAKHFTRIKFIDQMFVKHSDLFNETLVLLNFLSHIHNVENFKPVEPTPILDVDVNNREDCPILWVFGCSMSHGVGLDFPEQRYGHLLSTAYGMPVRFVTMPGSSTSWSLKHLTNANIRPRDLVVWQLTTPHRTTLTVNSVPTEFMFKEIKDRHVIAALNEDQILYNQLLLLNQGVQYLRALSIKFAIISILNKMPNFYSYMINYTGYKEYCYIPNQEIDIGNDGVHSGPLTHQLIANQLIAHLSCG
jgi:hypothetical protein